MSASKKPWYGLENICRICVGIAFSVLIMAVIVQVVGRIIGASPVWTEELSRFAVLYLAAFGTGLAYKSGDLVNVEIVCENLLPDSVSRILRLISAIITAGMSIYLLPASWKYAEIGKIKTLPATGIRGDFVQIIVLILLVLLFVFAVKRVFGMLFRKEAGLPDNQAELDAVIAGE